jgi:hypothetical protein
MHRFIPFSLSTFCPEYGAALLVLTENFYREAWIHWSPMFQVSYSGFRICFPSSISMGHTVSLMNIHLFLKSIVICMLEHLYTLFRIMQCCAVVWDVQRDVIHGYNLHAYTLGSCVNSFLNYVFLRGCVVHSMRYTSLRCIDTYIHTYRCL